MVPLALHVGTQATNYLPVIQDISHNQITESRSCGTDDANADAADVAAATDAAATDATAAAAAAVAATAVAAAAATIHSCQTRVTLVLAWPANEHTLLVIRTHPGGSRAKSLPHKCPETSRVGDG